ncbi:hypothetical protein Tsubulata_005634, partial [Turnera subulata]
RSWDLSGIPCAHALCVIHRERAAVTDFVSDWYTLDKFEKSYEPSIQTVRGRKFWPNTGKPDLLPPKVDRMPGRKKSTNRQVEHWWERANGKNPRGTRKTHCTVCHKAKHNRKTCPLLKQAGGQTSNPTNVDQSQANETIMAQSQSNTTSVNLIPTQNSVVAPTGRQMG